ncbi:MAG: hypothetical protein ACXVAX_08820 [Pseudobdellovibrio sp.]
MNISVSSIFASLLFSGIGLIALRRGKGESNIPLIIIGIVLMAYSYFTKSPWQDWLFGAGLTGGVYYYWHH